MKKIQLAKLKIAKEKITFKHSKLFKGIESKKNINYKLSRS